MNNLLYVGLDPSASTAKKSGACILNHNREIMYIGKWNNFGEISAIFKKYPAMQYLIGIDGPLQLPHELDTCCFSETPICSHRQTTSYKGRYCESLLIKKGYRCFMTSRNSFVKSWIRRCLALGNYLRQRLYDTIEVFPFASRRILFPDLVGQKQTNIFRKKLIENLVEWGIRFPSDWRIYSHDELDALLAAITALLHGDGQSERVGDYRDGYIIIPKI
jgi:predicted nuclease with RNAse H fold